MKYGALIRYYNLITELRAREKLDAASVASFPHMEEKTREKLRKFWLHQANFGEETEEPRMVIPWSKVRAFVQGKPVTAEPRQRKKKE